MEQSGSPKFIIIGASYAGLVAAAALKCAGRQLRIIERSTDRVRTGGGVVVQPRMLDYLKQHGVAMPDVASIPARIRKIFHADGTVLRMPENAAAYTSWDVLLRELEEVVGDGVIERGVSLVDLPDWGAPGIAELSTGEHARADVIIAADGIGSRARELLVPGIVPTYSGYVAWRGIADERDLSRQTRDTLGDSLSSFRGERTAILLYEIPGADGSISPGKRRVNWVWYHNVGAGTELDNTMRDTGGEVHRSTVGRGQIPGETIARINRIADEDLLEPFAEVVHATREPFVQKIEDLTLPRLVFGRVALIGDAASLIRPHIGSGTAKAVDDAITLAHALSDGCDPELTCLAAWEHTRLEDHLGLAEYARAIAGRLGLGTGTPRPTGSGDTAFAATGGRR